MNVLIAFGSSTGNTARTAEFIGNVFKKEGWEVKIRPVNGLQPETMDDYDVILLGSSTWGFGALQDAMKTFFFRMASTDLSGKTAGSFGTGDAGNYPRTFCKAVDLLQKQLQACGASTPLPGLKINGDPESSRTEAEEWARKIMEAAGE